MKKSVSVMGMLALVSALSVPVMAQQGGGAGEAGSHMGKMEKNERHPEIRHAIKSLERTKIYLQNASHDFGGHREAALKACDEAIRQLNEALKYDKK
ncbi:MAG TPA: hypothetical protein VGR50_03010 [Terriglobales bacterium]|nr:hypothetical protein [Terriglobales bacterium]